MKRIYFFATPSDIIPVLKRFETNSPLKFVKMGGFSNPDREIYLESTQIPNPGIATHETGSLSQGYIVSLHDTKNCMRSFVGKNGEKRWTLDNRDNEETVILNLAGLWKTGTLLPGSMSTLHTTPAAQQLMKWFLAALKHEGFTKIREWWLGHEAIDRLRSGKRLTTTAEQSPPEYDLKFPDKYSAILIIYFAIKFSDQRGAAFISGEHYMEMNNKYIYRKQIWINHSDSICLEESALDITLTTSLLIL